MGQVGSFHPMSMSMSDLLLLVQLPRNVKQQVMNDVSSIPPAPPFSNLSSRPTHMTDRRPDRSTDHPNPENKE